MSVTPDVGLFPNIKHVVAALESQITSDEEGLWLSQEVDDGFKGFMCRGFVATPSGGMNPMVDPTLKVVPPKRVEERSLVPPYEGQKSTASQATEISILRDLGCSVFVVAWCIEFQP